MLLKTIENILKILKDKGMKFKFFVCGEGMYASKLKVFCKYLGFTNDVEFTGLLRNKDLSLLYARANLLLFPSLYDSFGFVKVEAAAHSTPSVLIKGSAVSTGVTDEVNGFLSDDNKDAFAQKIIEAISDKELLTQIGQNAARDIFCSWDVSASTLIDKYKEIINNRQQAGALDN